MAFFGAYGMIILAMISYSLPYLTGNPQAERRQAGLGLWAFWLQAAGITGITMAFGAAGVAQVYLERILGLGYLETQAKLQVHFQMLTAAAVVFTLGVILFLADFFVVNPKRGVIMAEPEGGVPAGRG